MKSLLLLIVIAGTAYADKFPASGPCDDAEACEAACAKNKQGTCYWAGVLVLQSAAEGRYERAQPLFERACVKGDGEACFQVARVVAHVDYETTKAAGPKTVAAFKRACGKNHARACGEYAYYLGEAGDAKSKKLAAAMHEKSAAILVQRCLKNNMVKACGWASYIYEDGLNVKKSKKTADRLRTHACKLDPNTCAKG